MIFRKEKVFSIQKRVAEIKVRTRPEPFDWYRFDSFTNLSHLEKILPGGVEAIPRLAEGDPVADIGAADGDLSFLVEDLGCSVTAIDWPATNANQMLGIQLLKRELDSRLKVLRVDIDEQFDLPGERFGLAVCLGLLYHLKNPYFFLEKLSRHTRHCLLSTRILPRDKSQEAVVYLTGDREFLDDATNFWFFSEAGLRRLIDRTGWDVKSAAVIGDGVDDRFFCHLGSRFSGSVATFRLTHGWHELESNTWRWTEGRFGAVLEIPETASRFVLQFRIVPELLVESGSLSVSARVNGIELEAVRYALPGDYVYQQNVLVKPGRCEFAFELSHVIHEDDRQLGVIVITPPSGVVTEACGIRLLP